MNLKSTAKLTNGYDFNRREQIYELRISDFDFIELNLTNNDRTFIDDIQNNKSSKTPVADVLSVLEMIVRKIEEKGIPE